MIPKPTHKKRSKAQEWLTFRVAYLKKHVKENGWYECLDCGRWMRHPEVDHKQRRGSYPELVFDESNLRILCGDCHQRKDSGLVYK